MLRLHSKSFYKIAKSKTYFTKIMFPKTFSFENSSVVRNLIGEEKAILKKKISPFIRKINEK